MSYKISSNCVCCHYCRLECPVSAIDYDGPAYAIDPDKCTGCGLCEKLCPVSAISDPDKPVEVTPHEPISLDCDVVVVGSGGSGVTAAVKIAEEGKRVILVEAGKKIGGNTYLAHGAGFTGSKVQQALGIEDTTDDTLRRIMSRSLKNRPDPKKLEDNVRASGQFFDWFAEREEVLEPFVVLDTGWMRFNFAYRRDHNLKCRDQAIGPGWMGSWFIDNLMLRGKDCDLTVLTEHRAVKLLMDGGKAVGIECADPGGKTVIKANAVILATGGFLHNEEMMREHYPWFFDGEENPVHKFNVSTNIGDGHKMVEAIGGEVDYQTTDVNIGGPAHHPFGYCAYRVMREPEAVYVNMDGRRFMDENGGLNDGKYLMRTIPKATSYCIVDEYLLTTLGDRLAANPPDTFDDWILRDYREEIEQEIALGDVLAYKADTLEELAEKIGMPAGSLVAEIKKYNGFAANGRDDDFFKKPKDLAPIVQPPFYAFYQKSFSEGTHGGIAIDEDFRVLKPDGSIIDGLFAGGDCARTDMELGLGPIGRNGGLGGAFSGGYKIGLNVLGYLENKSR